MPKPKNPNAKENKKKYDQNYVKENMHRIPLNIRNSFYEAVKEHAYSRGESVNGFIKRAITETMEKDHIKETEK